MRYGVEGPFELPRESFRRLDMSNEAKREFWESVVGDVARGCGCYVFALRSRGLMVWYVGKTEKRAFRDECFAPHKIVIYNDVVYHRKGTPVLLLVPQLTASGRYGRPSKNGRREVAFLENLLIGLAVGRNPALKNVKGTRLQKIQVPGVLNTARGSLREPAKALKEALGV